MASCSKKIIFFSFIITMTIPSSIGHQEKWRRSHEPITEHYLRDLCSKTSRPNECSKIMKSKLHRIDDSDDKTIVGAVMDLAIAKSGEIHDKLNHLYSDSRNNELKKKYITCSKNYNDIHRDLVVARRDLDEKDHLNINIPVELKDAEEELKNCRRQFEKKSFDPAHIGDRNKEIGLYLEIVGVAIHNHKIHNHKY